MLVAALLATAFAIYMRTSWSPVWLWCLGFVGAILLWVIWPRVEFRKFRSELERANFRLCLTCGYNLMGLPDLHACPECGTRYDAPKLKATWEYWIKNRRLPKEAYEERGSQS